MIRGVMWSVWSVAIVLALAGPMVAGVLELPNPQEPIGGLFEPASAEHIFGTDRLGRDIAARMLAGNAILVVVPLISAVLSTATGLLLGTLAVRYAKPGFRMFLDALLVIPPIILMLAIAASTGLSPGWLVFGSVLLSLPFSSRFFESILQRVLAAGFIETALCSGQRWQDILFHEVLPVLARPIGTDMSLRFIATVYLTATASFLGGGNGDDTWATLIHSGLSGVTLNPWGVAAPALAIIALTVPPSVLLDQGDSL